MDLEACFVILLVLILRHDIPERMFSLVLLLPSSDCCILVMTSWRMQITLPERDEIQSTDF